MNKINLLFLIITLSFYGFTQYTQQVRGVIVDTDTKNQLYGVKVQLVTEDSTLFRAISDESGAFSLSNVPIGKHEISFSLMSYDKKSMTIYVQSGKENVLEVQLMESFLNKEEVQVSARKKGETINELGMVSSQQFSVEETNRYPGSRSDPARMASNFAGVQGADDSRNDIIVRGNSPLGIIYKVEGIDIPNPNHFAISGSSGGPVSILNNKMLSNSDFFLSAFPAEYGNSISGIFDLKLRNGNNQQHEFTGQFGFLGTEFLLEGPLSNKQNSSYLVMGRYSTLSLFNTLGIKIGTDAVPQYADAAFKFNWKLKNGGNLSLFGIGGQSNIEIIISEQKEYSTELYGEGDRDQYFGTSMGVGGLIYKKSISPKTFFTSTTAFSFEEQHSHHDYLIRSIDTLLVDGRETYPIQVDSIYPLMGYQFKTSRILHHSSVNYKINNQHLIKYGLNLETQFISMQDSALHFTHAYFLKRWNYTGIGLLVQPFAQWKYRISEKMDFSAGLHAQYYSVSNSLSPFEPRIGWKYRVNNKSSLSAGAGLHSQTQPLYTYFYTLQDSTNSNTNIHNINMDFTKSIHNVIGFEHFFSKSLQMKSEAYYQYLYAIPVELRPSAFSLINQGSGFARFFPDTLQNTGTGYNYGIELSLQKYFDKSFYFLFSGSLYNSKYKGSDNIERHTSYSSLYTLNVLTGKEFKINKKQLLGIGIKTTYAGGRRYGYVDLNQSRLLNEVIFQDSLMNERQFRPYFRFDIKINWVYNARFVTHEIGIDIVNLFNTRNLLGLAYAPNLANPSAEPIAEKQQLGRLPLFYYKIDFKIKGKK